MIDTFDKRIVYVTTRDRIDGFAGVVQNARRAWKPLIIHPVRLAEALEVLRPEVLVLDADLEDVECHANHSLGGCSQTTVVTNDRDLDSLAGLLATI